MTEQDLINIENMVKNAVEQEGLPWVIKQTPGEENFYWIDSPYSPIAVDLSLEQAQLFAKAPIDLVKLTAEVFKMREYLDQFGELSQYEEWRDF